MCLACLTTLRCPAIARRIKGGALLPPGSWTSVKVPFLSMNMSVSMAVVSVAWYPGTHRVHYWVLQWDAALRMLPNPSWLLLYPNAT